MTADSPRYGTPDIQVDGGDLGEEVVALLEELIVDDHLVLPDMFEMVFRNLSGNVLEDAHLRIGSEVTIACNGPDDAHSGQLIKGEVTGIEGRFDDDGVFVVVRGYDKSHRLHRGRHTHTYNNVKISDVAQQIAGDAGLSIGTIDDSGPTLDHVSLANTSHWEFLTARAREIDYEVLVLDGKFHFRKPAKADDGPAIADDYDASTQPTQLRWGDDLIAFHPRISAAEQVGDVQVRTWDPKNKQVIVGTAQATADHASLDDGDHTPASLAGLFDSPTYVSHHRALSVQDEADDLADALSKQIGSAFFEADGIAHGSPKLRAGAAVSISMAGPFSGKYTLTHTRHVFDGVDGYRTHFIISGRQDRSLLGLTSLGAANGVASLGGPPIHGMVVAQVTDNDDPDDCGRVKLKFPWLSDDYESDWARTMMVGAGPDSGVLFYPEVNDEVLVAFEHGDVRRPYVLGPLHNGQDKPKLGDSLFDNGKVKRRGVVSRKGHRLIFFDDDSTSGIALLSSDGNLKVALDESDSEIRIHCQGKVTISTDSDKITVQSGGDLEVTAQGQLTLQGQQGVALKSSATVDIDGATITLN